MAPGSCKGDLATALEIVVLGVDIKISHLLDSLAGWILRDRPQIKDTQTQGVVTLVREAILDKLASLR